RTACGVTVKAVGDYSAARCRRRVRGRIELTVIEGECALVIHRTLIIKTGLDCVRLVRFCDGILKRVIPFLPQEMSAVREDIRLVHCWHPGRPNVAKRRH